MVPGEIALAQQMPAEVHAGRLQETHDGAPSPRLPEEVALVGGDELVELGLGIARLILSAGDRALGEGDDRVERRCICARGSRR